MFDIDERLWDRGRGRGRRIEGGGVQVEQKCVCMYAYGRYPLDATMFARLGSFLSFLGGFFRGCSSSDGYICSSTANNKGLGCLSMYAAAFAL